MEIEEGERQSYSEQEKGEIFNHEFLPHINSMYNLPIGLLLIGMMPKTSYRTLISRTFRFIESFKEELTLKRGLFRILKKQLHQRVPEESKEPNKVDYQEVESYYNSEEVDRVITPDLRVDALKDMIGDEISMHWMPWMLISGQWLFLCDLEGLSMKRWRRFPGHSHCTVRSRLHRARQLPKKNSVNMPKSMGYN